MGTSHSLSLTTNNHSITGAITYTDIAARDAATSFHSEPTNINKVVRVNSPLSFFVLTEITPSWLEFTSTASDQWTELDDTPGSISAGLVVQGNSGGTELEFGQDLRAVGNPSFSNLTLTGDLTVNGTTTTINSTTLTVDDKNIELGSVDTPTDVTADGGGITLKGSTDKTIIWDNTTNTWQFNQDLVTADSITIGSLASPATSASIDLTATDKALLHNRLTTTERDALAASGGMAVFNTTNSDLEFYNGTAWQSMGGGDVVGPASSITNNIVSFLDTGGKNIKDSGIAAGFINQNVSTGGSPSFIGLDVDNINLNGNSIISTNTNGNININPDGTGELIVDVVNSTFDITGNTKVRGGTNSNKYDLVELSSTDIGSGPFGGGKVRGNFYYIADTLSDNLFIYDLTDLAAPELIGTLNISNSGFGGIDVVGQYVFLTDTATGERLHIVDALDKTAPVVVSSLALTGVTNPRGVRARAGVTFVVSDGQFASVDITDLSNPKLLQVISIPGNGRIDFELEGVYAYIATSDSINNINIISVSDPSNMSIIGQFDMGTECRALRKERSKLYCAGDATQLRILDVSDPTTPTLLASYSVGGDPRVMDVQNEIIYIGRQSGDDIAVIDASNLSNIVEITNLFSVDQNPVALDVQGNIMYVLDGNIDTLKIIDVSGTDVQNLKSGSIETTRATIIKDLIVGNSITADGVQVGGGGVASGGQITSTVDGNSKAVAQKSDNVVQVFIASQLPTTLVAGTHYLLMAPITITAGNEITIPNAAGITIESTDRITNTLTYSGTTGTLFTAAAMTGSLTFLQVNLFGNNNTTRLFNLTGSGFPSLFMDSCDVRNWGAVSELSVFGGGIAIGKMGGSGNAAGIFNVVNSVFFGLENCFFQNFSDTSSNFFTVDSLTSRVSISLTGVVAQPNERVLNVNSGFTGEVIVNNVFAVPTGLLFAAAGLDETSVYVNVAAASNQKDSKTIGSYLVDDNATATTFAGNGTWTDLNLNAGAVVASNAERFTLTNTTTGELTYIGLEPFSGIIFFVAYATSSGGAQDFEMRAVKNGSVLSDTFEPTLNIGSDRKAFTVSVPVELVTDDLVRPQALRIAGTTSLTISHITMNVE